MIRRMTPRGELIIGTIEEVHAHQIQEWRMMSHQAKADLFVDLMRVWMPEANLPTELFGYLNSYGVNYLVVGAAATAVHAQPRYTDDLDLWLRRTEANIERLRSTLVDLGFSARRADLHAFCASDRRKITLGSQPSRVDLFNFQTNADFESSWSNRVEVRFADVSVPILGLQELVTIKRAVAGYLDLFDIALIEEIHGPQPL